MTVIKRKVQFFGISSLAKVEDSTRSWCVYLESTLIGDEHQIENQRKLQTLWQLSLEHIVFLYELVITLNGYTIYCAAMKSFNVKLASKQVIPESL